MTSSPSDIARTVLSVESAALTQLAEALPVDFDAVVARLLALPGRVIVSGMGKSGHVANKIAATLARTGTPAQAVHPGEASHGDLGMITRNDAVILISNSGEQVAQGSRLVGKAGEALRGIIGRIADVSEHIDQIAQGAKDQSTGLDELASGVRELDTVTQRNSAVAQETSDASAYLRKRVESMTDHVQKFKMGAMAAKPAQDSDASDKPQAASAATASNDTTPPKPTAAETAQTNSRPAVDPSAPKAAAAGGWQDF